MNVTDIVIPRDHLPQEDAYELLEKARKANKNIYSRGALVDLRGEGCDGKEIILVGDLHGRLDNLIKILNKNNNFEKLKKKQAFLILLGDAVHNEPRKDKVDEEEIEWMKDMSRSLKLAQFIMELKTAFPDQFFYLIGNHDYLSVKFRKCGVRQGWEFRNYIKDTYDESYVELYREFIASSPVLVIAKEMVANHAGPMDAIYSLDTLEKIDLMNEDEDFLEQLQWRRWGSQNKKFSYSAPEVEEFLAKVIKMPEAYYFVGHSPYLLKTKEFKVNNFVARMMRKHYMVYAAYDHCGFASYRYQSFGSLVSFISV